MIFSCPIYMPLDISDRKLITFKMTRDGTSTNRVAYSPLNHLLRAGVDGVMAARGLLENPALFRGDESCPWEAVEVFIRKVVRQPIPFNSVVNHLSEMCGSDGGQCGKTLLGKEERRELMGCRSMVELIDYLDSVREIRRL